MNYFYSQFVQKCNLIASQCGEVETENLTSYLWCHWQ